jgi:hypothetical protein
MARGTVRGSAALGWVPRAASATATLELELPPPCERIDVALRLGLVERVLLLNLCHQIVLVLESGDLLGAGLAHFCSISPLIPATAAGVFLSSNRILSVISASFSVIWFLKVI